MQLGVAGAGGVALCGVVHESSVYRCATSFASSLVSGAVDSVLGGSSHRACTNSFMLARLSCSFEHHMVFVYSALFASLHFLFFLFVVLFCLGAVAWMLGGLFTLWASASMTHESPAAPTPPRRRHGGRWKGAVCEFMHGSGTIFHSGARTMDAATTDRGWITACGC